jgi:hypothetical protein
MGTFNNLPEHHVGHLSADFKLRGIKLDSAAAMLALTF